MQRGSSRNAKYLFQRKRGGKWYGRIFDADGIWRQRALSHDKVAAEEFRAELQRQEDRKRYGLEDVAKQTSRIEPALTDYMKELKSGARKRSEQHIKDAEYAVRTIIKMLPASKFSDIKVDRLLDVRRRLAEPVVLMRGKKERLTTRSTRTINKIVGQFQTFIRWCLHAGKIEVDPTSRLRRIPESEATLVHARQAFSVDQASRIIAIAENIDRSKTGTEGQAIVARLLLETGLRLNEACSLQRRDLVRIKDTMCCVVRASVSKTKRERVVPMRPILEARIQASFQAREKETGLTPGPDAYVLLTRRGEPWATSNRHNLRRWLRVVLAGAGIPRQSEEGRWADFHAFRHSFNNFLVEAGVGREVREVLMGHSDGSTNAIYTDRQRMIGSLIDAVSKLPVFDRAIEASATAT